MEKSFNVKNMIKYAGSPKEGDVVFVGEFCRTLSPLEEALELLLVEGPLKRTNAPLEEVRRGYVRVDKLGNIVYNCMENAGIFGAFLRRHGVIGPDKNWNKNINSFNYQHAFRMSQGRLEEVSGNLVNFRLDYSKSILRDLDFREITEFLKVGDYSSTGTIEVS